MKSNILLLFPLLRSLLYFASSTLCQLQIRQGQLTTAIGGTTNSDVGDKTYYYVAGTTYYLTSGNGGIATFTVTAPQAPATTILQPPAVTVIDPLAPAATFTVTSNQPAASTVTVLQAPTTTVINSQAPTTTATIPQGPPTTVTIPQPPATATAAANSQPATTPIIIPQPPTTTVANSQPAATIPTNSQASAPTIATSIATNLPSSQATVASASSQPVATTLSTLPSAAATSEATSVPPLATSGNPPSITYSSVASSPPPVTPTSTTPTSAPPATTTSSHQRDIKKVILDALQKVPNIDRFVAALNESVPNILEQLDPESNYTIFAPNNAAMEGGSKRLGRRGAYNPELALSFVKRGATDPPLTSGPRTLNTELTDQQYVNLGPGEPAKIVSLPLDKDLNIATGGGTYLGIVSGKGRNATFKDQGFLFDAGAINVANKWALPFPFPRVGRADIDILQPTNHPRGPPYYPAEHRRHRIREIPRLFRPT